MNKFIKIESTNMSIAMRSLVCGIGVNDAWYITNPKINGKTTMCPVYRKWINMMQRCYNENIQKKNKTYIGCSVSPEWFSFMAFHDWYAKNNIDGWQLDKDIKNIGNKVYSERTCLFVPSSINSLLCDSMAIRGRYPTGVCKQKNGFIAYIKIDGKRKHLGTHGTPLEAYEIYRKAKNTEIDRKCDQYPAIAEYLIKHKLGAWNDV